MSLSSLYLSERIEEARRAFFEDDRVPDGLVNEPVLRSWVRCRALGLRAAETVEFAPVARGQLLQLFESEKALLDAAHTPIEMLTNAVKALGYTVLLTDAHGQALSVSGHEPLHGIRPGADLSENNIGTTAMSLALSELRSMRVLGAEHYFTVHSVIHCCATPVFNPQGRLAGVVNVSRDRPGLAPGTAALTQRCARQIERRLFDAQSAFLRVNLEPQGGAQEAWLAFDQDARLLAATPMARQLMDLWQTHAEVGFTDLFEGRFETLVQAAQGIQPSNLILQGGLRLQANAFTTVPRIRSKPHVLPERVSTAHQVEFGDPAFDLNFQMAKKASEAGLPILIHGETGTGKEVAARALHAAGSRRNGPFIALNCGAIAPQLMAAELFGYVEGAYTGARRGGSAGRIEAAEGGTLLLDEIGDMPMELQVGLLRVLDSGEVVRVGATQGRRIDVRFVCATHRNLQTCMAEGRFREDLYYRISAYTLEVPTLRERQDFNALLDALLHQQGHSPERIDAVLRQQLRDRRWPGNVRQLQHQLRLALALSAENAPLNAACFPVDPNEMVKAEPAASQEIDWRLDRTESDTIEAALVRTGGNVTAAAALLGIGRATLYRKLRNLKAA
jgi:sigma-54 dependent transcriptional regulator, acetoin dehydrogenase operon transcriptional activator AcoR